MSEAIKPTPGPWTVVENSWEVSTVSAGSVEVARCYVDCNVTEDTLAEDEATMNANACLIAESGTVAHETGLTPRQLVERVKELEDTLCSLAGRFLHCAAAGISAAEAYDSFYRDDVAEVLSKALPNADAKEAGK